MATVKNFGLAGVSADVQFGKGNGRFKHDGTDFQATASDGSTLANIDVAAPTADEHASTKAYVDTTVAAFVPTLIATLDTSVVTSDTGSDGAIAFNIDGATRAQITDSIFDLSTGTVLSASDGTIALPAYTFETDLDAGLSYAPGGGPNSEDQVTMSSDGKAITKFRVGNGLTGNDYLVTEAGDGEVKMLAEGAAANIDIRLTPKGVGQVFIGDQGTAASISASDSTVDNVDGEILTISAGDGFAGAATTSDGGNLILIPGLQGGGTSVDGFIDLQDANGQSVMQFVGVASAVNFFTATNAATTGGVTLASAGTDTDVDIILDPQGAGVINASTSTITNVVDPTAAQDAATKQYVDDQVSGVSDATRIHDTADTTFIDTDVAAGRIDVTSVAGLIGTIGTTFDINAGGAITLDGNGASNLTTTAGALTLSTVTSGNLNLTSAGDLVGSGAAVTLDATGGMSLDAGGASNFTTSSGNLTLDSAATLALDGTTSITLDSALIDLNSTGPVTIDGVGNSNLTIASGDLTLSTSTSGNLILSPAGFIDANSNLISNVTDPVVAQDAATKSYVDTVAQGLTTKESVHGATVSGTAGLAGATYTVIDAGADSGVGDTLTAGANGAFDFDGNTSTFPVGNEVVVGLRFLVKDHANPRFNGIYTVTDLGSGATPWVVTRAVDFDNSPSGEIPEGSFTFVQFGTVNAQTGWTLTGQGSGAGNSFNLTNEAAGDTTGDDLVFTQFSGIGTTTIIGGDGITSTQNGTEFTIDADADEVTITATGGTGNVQLAVFGGLVGQVIGGAGVAVDAAWGYQGSLRDANGVINIDGSQPVASGVNFLQVTGGATTVGVTLAATGSDLNVDLILDPKGTGIIDASSSLISNVTNPSSAQDAATKDYVDTEVGNISTSSIELLNTSVAIVDTGTDGTITTIADGTVVVIITDSLMDIDVQIQATDGSAAAPAYAFETTANDGLYFTANGGVAVADGGVQAMELGLTSGHASMTALGTNINIVLVPTGTGFIDASASLISNVLDPSSGQDAATKAYVDAATANGTFQFKATVVLTGLGVTAIGTLPAGATVTRVMTNVSTGSDNASVLQVGLAGDVGKYQPTAENDAETVGLYVSDLMTLEASSQAVQADVSGVAGIVGSADVIVEYRVDAP